MPSAEIHDGSRESETFELLSHSPSPSPSLDTPPKSPSAAPPAGRRRRVRQARPAQPHERGLLGRSTGHNKVNASGPRIALELITQATPSLLCAVVGSAITGLVFDQVQFWSAFVKIHKLFILVPILLNLKGCLEMNLASR